MNRPDDRILSSWLDGELEGDELRQVEAWAETNAAELDAEFKCEIGWDALNDEALACLPGSEEPPYPEFFNSKIQQAISDEMEPENVVVPISPASSFWQKLRLMLAPAAVAALVAFYAGTQMQGASATSSAEMVSDQSSIYVPHSGIVAAVSESSEATEIVLDGLAPISDELDIAAGETSLGDSPMMANADDEASTYIFF